MPTFIILFLFKVKVGGLFCPPPPSKIGCPNTPSKIGLINAVNGTCVLMVMSQSFLQNRVSIRKIEVSQI